MTLPLCNLELCNAQDLVSIIGAVTGSPVMFALPPLFYYLGKAFDLMLFDKFVMLICRLSDEESGTGNGKI